jgi:hypothetical protein
MGLARSTAICVLVFGLLLTATAVQSRRLMFFGTEAMLTLLVQGVVVVCLAAFVLRLLRWARWSSLLLANMPIFLTIAAGCSLFEFGRWGFRDGMCTDILSFASVWSAVLLAGALIPASIGMLLGWWADSRIKTARLRRRLAVGGSITVLLTVLGPPVQESAVAWYTGTHAEAAGIPAMRCNASALRHTVVTPTLECPVTAGTNLIWCATLSAAWNALADYCGGPVDMSDAAPIVAVLNRPDVPTNTLDASTFVADAGPAVAMIPRVRAALQEKFHGQASPELLPPSSPDLMVYAYLFINMPFETAFERLPMTFGTNAVKGFGLLKPQSPGQRHAGQQVVVHETGPDGTVIELLTRRADHQLILADVHPGTTLLATATNVLARLKTNVSGKEHAYDLLQVPILNFDILRDYAELTGHTVRVHGANPRQLPLLSASQQVRFRLDERGAVLKSEVAMLLGSPPALRFDHPFLILLRRKGANIPYFAVWVDNPEILVPLKQ